MSLTLDDPRNSTRDARAPSHMGPRRDASNWIVVTCQPHKEGIALENLRKQGFTCYAPMIRRQVRHARRTYESVRPLFPNYLFVAFDFGRQLWRPLLSSRGVRSIVCCGDAPSVLKSDVIESLRAREVEGAIVRPVSPYRVGQKVRITRGSLDGLVATIIDLDERDRIVVLLDLLSRAVRVNVKVDLVGEIDPDE